MKKARFEFVSKFKDCGLALPERKTQCSAGYDLACAQDCVIPSYHKLMEQANRQNSFLGTFTLDQVANFTKTTKIKPTLVSTGLKCYLPKNTYLELSVRSSTPLKYWLVLANGVGIIDADYADSPTGEGEIFLQLINLSPVDIQIKKGDIIGQGIIKQYEITEDDKAEGERQGGFGSTSEQANVIKASDVVTEKEQKALSNFNQLSYKLGYSSEEFEKALNTWVNRLREMRYDFAST